MRLFVVVLLLEAAMATPITTRQDLLGRYQQHSLHRLKRFSFWPFSRKKDSTTTSTTTTTENIIKLPVLGIIPTSTSRAAEVREEEPPRGFWGNLNPFRGLSNLAKKGYEKVRNSTVGQAIRNSSVGRAFRSGRNATSRAFIVIGRTMRSGARSVGHAVRKIKRRLTGEEKYRYFVEQVRKGVDGGDQNTLAMLDKLGINVTVDKDGVAHTVVRNNTPTATEIMLSEGFFPHNTSVESSGDGRNGASLVTDDSEGSGGETAREGWPTTSTTSSPATTLSTPSTTTTSRTTTSVPVSAIIFFPNTTLRTLPTTTTQSSPSTITLHTTSWPMTSPPTTTQAVTAPSKNDGRDTNIEPPLEECAQQWCYEIAVTALKNTTDHFDTEHESESNETDTVKTEKEVFNRASISGGVSPKLTPTTENTLLTWAPGSHEMINHTAESTVVLASSASSSLDEDVLISPSLKHNTDDHEATVTALMTTAKSSLFVVETSTLEPISHLPVAYIPASSAPSSSTSSPAATVNPITTVTLPVTSSNNATVTQPTTSTTKPPQAITTEPTIVQTLPLTQPTTSTTKPPQQAITSQPTFVQTLPPTQPTTSTTKPPQAIISQPTFVQTLPPTQPHDLTATTTQESNTDITDQSADSLTSPATKEITLAPALPVLTSPPTVSIVTIIPTKPNATSTSVVASVTSPPTIPAVTLSTSSTFIGTTPLILTIPITSTTHAPITTTSLPTTSSTTTTPSPTTTLVTIRAISSLPITTTTSSPPTTTIPTTIELVTSPQTTTIPTTSKPTTPPLLSTPPPVPLPVTDTLAGAAGELEGSGGNDGGFPSPFRQPTDEAGFPSPFGGSGGDDEFPDVFNSKGVRDRLREIYEKGDFSHDDLRNAFNFDPNDYHYYYDYGN